MDRHLLDPSADSYSTLSWLNTYGYLGMLYVNPRPKMDDDPVFPRGFLAFGRPGEPLVSARSRDTLVWDGEKITVELRDETEKW